MLKFSDLFEQPEALFEQHLQRVQLVYFEDLSEQPEAMSEQYLQKVHSSWPVQTLSLAIRILRVYAYVIVVVSVHELIPF